MWFSHLDGRCQQSRAYRRASHPEEVAFLHCTCTSHFHLYLRIDSDPSEILTTNMWKLSSLGPGMLLASLTWLMMTCLIVLVLIVLLIFLWTRSSYCSTWVHKAPGDKATAWLHTVTFINVHNCRGGWSHYYMNGAAPITQYMAASTQFNLLSQQIIIYIRAKLYVLTSSGMCVR